MTLRLNRRSMMRGLLGGAAVCVGLPSLDQFLNGNGDAWADGAKLPVRFGTYFWGLGLTDTPTGGTRWVPKKIGADYEITPELEFFGGGTCRSWHAVNDEGRPRAAFLPGVKPDQCSSLISPMSAEAMRASMSMRMSMRSEASSPEPVLTVPMPVM